MPLDPFLAAVRTHLLDPLAARTPWARGAWCRKQRRRLDARRGAVVWIRGDALRWAEWGARVGYFEVQYMDGLPYLRAVQDPVA
ncbi:hypothetical protein [Anaeromyxobacter oryzae]|uniref:Uncharacterized protein n=1 Tax=Anaeromyxobacter oryzae TaxID=2918170 RepID=A0ABM7WZ13_9BACT|nr:hypothetical protein [Anaeromyxobacter oryzae]BDG04725.1 hypothetical protein AMOR_37210 [Anaeromyxobacter oryzae]